MSLKYQTVLCGWRLFLLDRDEKAAFFYGCQYKAVGGYNSGGPGYVISAHNLASLSKAFADGSCGDTTQPAEDIRIAECLAKVVFLIKCYFDLDPISAL